MKQIIAFLTVALMPSLVYANAGVFAGSGHTIKLIRSDDIEMRSEKVTITPGRGRFLFDGSVPGMDRVEYRCKFVLHNRSKKPVTIQVGFPLTSDEMGRPKVSLEPDDVTSLVLKYKFIARDNLNTYHVRFAPSDSEKMLSAIFLWDMTFQADEVRELNVAYEIPMATGMVELRKDEGRKSYDKGKYYWKLEVAIFEAFDYVTVTGQSWAGPIKHATFDVHVGEFERYLAERTILETPKSRVAEHSGRNTATDIDFHIRNRVIDREMGPNGWKEKDGVITWEFENYRPKDGIGVSYTLTIFPRTPESVPKFVEFVLGGNPSSEDLGDLREILLARSGISPKSESVRQFVSNQRWYSPKDGMTVDKLTTEQKAVISAIEHFPTTKPSPTP